MGQFFNYLQNEYVEDLDLDSLQNQAMDYILSSLDPHSVYIPAEQGAARRRGEGRGGEGVLRREPDRRAQPDAPGPHRRGRCRTRHLPWNL